jgi:hypothetical protein
MSKWILSWCDSGNTICNGKEEFDSKENVKDRLEELKQEVHEDELEWELFKATKCKCCGTYIRED